LNLQFTVFDIAGKQVHIDTIRVKVSKDAEDNIPLILIDTIPVDAPGSPSALGMDCKTSFCRMKAMIMDKIRQALEKAKAAAEAAKNSKPAQWIKGCHGKFRGGRPHSKGGRPHHQGAKPDGHGRRPHHGPHAHHHHDGRRFRHFFIRFTHQFVVPILFGVAAGMTAGAIGMVIGHAIGFLWIKFARGGQRGPYARVSQQEEAIESDEKDVLIEEPPQYEELEVDSVKVDERN